MVAGKVSANVNNVDAVNKCCQSMLSIDFVNKPVNKCLNERQ